MKLRDLREIAIVGPGLLGGSIALGLKAAGLGARVTGIGHRQPSIDAAIAIGAIDRGSLRLGDAADAQLVILATPIGLFEPVLRGLGDILHPGAVVTDVGSTKRLVCRLARQLLPRTVHFVGSHPMAGSEKRGIEFARADLCQNATCILTPTAATDPDALTLARELWSALGMTLAELPPARHDTVLARISHLPHLAAAALVNLCEPDELRLAGPGFLDTTRIASGDTNLWHDIIASNSDQILRALATVRHQLHRLERAVAAGNSTQIRAFLDSARQKRDELLRFRIETRRLEP